jgi:hypothetical protein
MTVGVRGRITSTAAFHWQVRNHLSFATRSVTSPALVSRLRS